MSHQAFSTGQPASPAQEVHVTGRRVLATIVDGIFFFFLFLPLNLITGLAGAASGSEEVAAGLSFLASLIALPVGFAYYVLTEGYWGRTLGKAVCGIRVIREDGGTPGFGPAAIRTILRLVDGLFGYLVAFVVVLASERRQRLGDMAARTLVVRG
ncbi:hypothetical protein RxyAA322_04660 [Rubrobacter xylanophilus]|uniref:RDD domain-containing protein n=1 Tax=Rubrobacter xylanophilus TaxID=49319 RepID=A0A510HF79_9ACTN|nr:RDD family protein [Rubrobacter xylanophilus]BBL78612.1 hypothetical protein RxyAA322_04660 [Rubrobacter xylanophilus]